MKIQIITTGGTIDKVYFDANSQFEIGESHVPEILSESHVSLEYEVLNLLRKDSLELTDRDRTLIRTTIEGLDSEQIVVTHGTDTMVQTAQALKGIPGKTIVLTGSLSPARFKSSDAVFNVASALIACQCLESGVYITMSGRIFDPDHVRKNRTKNRFESIEGDALPTSESTGAPDAAD